MEGRYCKQVLENGIRVVTEEIPQVRSVAIGFWIKTGSRYETSQVSGISHFIEHLLFKGTTSRTPQQIAHIIDSVGGQLDAFTSREYTCYFARVLDEHLPLVVELLSDMLLHPEFAAAELEVERQVILEEIKTTEDTPEEHVHDLLITTLWPEHPLGQPVQGRRQSLKAISRSQVVDYFTQYYSPPHIIVAVAGNIKHAQVVELLQKWYNPPPTLRAVSLNQQPPKFNSRVVSYVKDLEQVHLCLGTPGLPQNHADRFGGYILNIILGNGNGSRLFQEIREKRGLAYNVYSYANSFTDTGLYAVYASTSPESYLQVIQLILNELERLKKVEISAEELQRSKNQLKSNLVLSLENTTNRMTALAKNELYFGCHISLDEILAGIEQVSASQIQRLANQLFDNRYLGLIVLGAVKEHPISEVLFKDLNSHP